MIVANGFVFKDQAGDTVFSANYNGDEVEITTSAAGENESFFVTPKDIAELASALAQLVRS